MGEGPPLVLLHGLLLGSLATFYFTAAPALARTHRVLLYDLRGHGRTERTTTGYCLATQAADLEALVNSAFGEGARVCLAGHSYGALVALRFALAHPGRVEKLCLIEAPLPPSRFEELAAFLGRSPDEQLAALPDSARTLFARPGRQAQRFVAQLGALASETTLFRELLAEPDVADEVLARLDCRTHCVYGAQSSCLPIGERLARVIPGATLERLAGGHFLPTEAAPALTAALVRFFHG